MKKFTSLALFIFVFNISAQTILKSKLDSLTNDGFFKSTMISLSVYNLDKNIQIYDKNTKLHLRPASNMKIVTSATVLDYLPTDYKLKTNFYYSGEIKDSVLKGNLYVKGGYDPMFTTSDLVKAAENIKKIGIKRIDGAICADVSNIDTLFWGSSWSWDDEPEYYCAHLTSLIINGNCIDVRVNPSVVGRKPLISFDPAVKFYNLVNNAITTDSASKTNIDVTRNWIYKTNDVIVNGAISANSKSQIRTINVEKPEQMFLLLFAQLLTEKGIEIKPNLEFEKVPEKSTIAYTYERDIKEVLTYLNKVSDNLSAETLLKLLGHISSGKPGSTDAGIVVVKNFIKKLCLNPNEYQIVDGSGLSAQNYISGELLTEILKYYYTQKDKFNILYKAFPIAGVDGTLKSRMKGTKAENNVHAKTGTINGVSSLSGYVKASNGDMLAFSVLIQNHVNAGDKARYFQNEICRMLAECKFDK